MPTPPCKYAGFWVRVAASLIDTALLLLVTLPLLLAIYGRAYFDGSRAGFLAGVADVMISWVGPAMGILVFWLYKQATPGKMMLNIQIIDAATGGSLSLGQSVVRYLGYFVSAIPLGLGLLWVGFDEKKQGWHDKMAGTLVIYTVSKRDKTSR